MEGYDTLYPFEPKKIKKKKFMMKEFWGRGSSARIFLLYFRK